jgi:hypothetical protein
MLRPGSRYIVITVAWLKSVAKMSAFLKVAFSATPAAFAFACESFTMSGLYSMPMERAPNFFAAAMAILPSPEPRSITRSFAVTCAMVSMRSTMSSGEGTQITSLPACPTCGSNFCAVAGAAIRNENAIAGSRRTKGVIGVLGEGGKRQGECSRNKSYAGETG